MLVRLLPWGSKDVRRLSCFLFPSLSLCCEGGNPRGRERPYCKSLTAPSPPLFLPLLRLTHFLLLFLPRYPTFPAKELRGEKEEGRLWSCHTFSSFRKLEGGKRNSTSGIFSKLFSKRISSENSVLLFYITFLSP